MKSILATLFTSGIISLSFAQDAWLQKDSVNGAPRSAASSFVVNGEGYIMGGTDDNGFRRSMYSYTFWQDDWDDEPSIGDAPGVNGSGNARGNACAFSLYNKGYVCLGVGDGNDFKNDLWQFDEDTDAWSQKATFIGAARRNAVSFVINDVAYVGTGIDQNGQMLKDMYKYNATANVWVQLNDFAGTARKEAVGFTMGGQGYIGTGDDGVMRDDFWQYEPTTDTWTQKASFPGTPRKGAVGWGQFPTAFICMGEDINFTYTNDLWEYNFFADAWVQRANYPGPGRSNAVVFIQNDQAFVGTGFNGLFHDDMYAYTRIVGNEELATNNTVKVHPNPVVDEFFVSSDIANAGIEMYTLDGKNITASLVITKIQNGFKINRMGLPTGNYILRLTDKDNGSIQTKKIIFA
jgi:N-acetylneuraminic acid mutarotase